jgi:hypothetical protein
MLNNRGNSLSLNFNKMDLTGFNVEIQAYRVDKQPKKISQSGSIVRLYLFVKSQVKRLKESI